LGADWSAALLLTAGYASGLAVPVRASIQRKGASHFQANTMKKQLSLDIK
jgi:hypothetical protein